MDLPIARPLAELLEAVCGRLVACVSRCMPSCSLRGPCRGGDDVPRRPPPQSGTGWPDQSIRRQGHPEARVDPWFVSSSWARECCREMSRDFGMSMHSRPPAADFGRRALSEIPAPRQAKSDEFLLQATYQGSNVYNGCHASFDKLMGSAGFFSTIRNWARYQRKSGEAANDSSATAYGRGNYATLSGPSLCGNTEIHGVLPPSAKIFTFRASVSYRSSNVMQFTCLDPTRTCSLRQTSRSY